MSLNRLRFIAARLLRALAYRVEPSIARRLRVAPLP